MDSLITAAARALAAGDALGALNRVALRNDPPAPFEASRWRGSAIFAWRTPICEIFCAGESLVAGQNIDRFFAAKRHRELPRWLIRSRHMLDAWPFLRSVRTRNAAPRKIGNSCANSVGHLVIIDLFRYQAEERIAIQEIH